MQIWRFFSCEERAESSDGLLNVLSWQGGCFPCAIDRCHMVLPDMEEKNKVRLYLNPDKALGVFNTEILTVEYTAASVFLCYKAIMASTSRAAPRGRAATCTALRAGKGSLKYWA